MLQEWARARAACSAEQSETLEMYDYIDTMHLGNLVPTHLAATRVESRNSVGEFCLSSLSTDRVHCLTGSDTVTQYIVSTVYTVSKQRCMGTDSNVAAAHANHSIH